MRAPLAVDPLAWATWAAEVRHPSDCPDALGLIDLEACVSALPDAELEAGLRRGLLWARMGFGECVVWASELGGASLAHELTTRQWAMVMAACHGALACARRPGTLRELVQLPDPGLEGHDAGCIVLDAVVPTTLPPERPWTLDDEVLP